MGARLTVRYISIIRPYTMTKITMDNTHMHRLIMLVSSHRPISSHIPIASSCVSRSASAAVTSMFPFIMPVLWLTTFWATSNTAMTIVKQLVSRYVATKVLKIHLKMLNVSKSCMLFFSRIIWISS